MKVSRWTLSEGTAGRQGTLSRPTHRAFLALMVLTTTALAGCGGAREQANVLATSSAYAPGGSTAGATSGSAAGASSESAGYPGSAGGSEKAAAAGAKPAERPAEVIPRKIIYTATVDLAAENLTSAQQALLALVKVHKGYIAEDQISGAAGAPRQGEWTIRVPVEEFDAFMTAAGRIGELQSVHTGSEEITAQYVDLEARLSNKQVEEERLLGYLRTKTDRLQDILAIEQEISRVRGEIEQMEGQLRLWANQASLSTVTVTIHEIKEYVTPPPPGFGNQIGRSFQGSVMQLRDFAKGILLILVVLTPWLVVFALIGVPVWFLWRRRRHP